MEKIKVAVIGAGLIGQTHARTYSGYDKCELVSVCDLDEKRAKEIARKYGCSYATDSREIADNTEIRAVSVVTPDFAHYQPVLQMIEAGKDVLCEKPLAMDVAEAEEMVSRAREKGVRLMVDFQNRWNFPFLQAKKEIESGTLGDPLVGYVRLSNPFFVPLKMLSWAARSGPEWFLLPHLIDLIRWLINQEAEEIYAVGNKGVLKSVGVDVFDTVQAMIRFKTASVVFEAAWILPDSWPSLVDFKVDLLGTKGKISIKGDHQGIDIAGDKFRYPFVLAEQNAFGKTVGFFQEPIIHFIDSIYYGKEPDVSGEDGLAVTKIIAAILRSIEEKKVVRL